MLRHTWKNDSHSKRIKTRSSNKKTDSLNHTFAVSTVKSQGLGRSVSLPRLPVNHIPRLRGHQRIYQDWPDCVQWQCMPMRVNTDLKGMQATRMLNQQQRSGVSMSMNHSTPILTCSKDIRSALSRSDLNLTSRNSDHFIKGSPKKPLVNAKPVRWTFGRPNANRYDQQVSQSKLMLNTIPHFDYLKNHTQVYLDEMDEDTRHMNHQPRWINAPPKKSAAMDTVSLRVGETYYSMMTKHNIASMYAPSVQGFFGDTYDMVTGLD